MLTRLIKVASLTAATALLSVGVTVADSPASAPKALEGDQPPSAADGAPACPGKFHYSSEVRIAPSGDITLNNLVKNEGPAGLVFRWDKVGKIRGVLNALPPGETDENPHPINAYDPNPDRDAPIEYTPQKCVRTASIYTETKSASLGALWNIIKSKFIDVTAGGVLRDLTVEMETISNGSSINYTIKADPQDVYIGLSGLPNDQEIENSSRPSIGWRVSNSLG